MTGPATLSVEVGDPLEKLEVTCLGVYIPVMTEAGRTSTVTVSFQLKEKKEVKNWPCQSLFSCYLPLQKVLKGTQNLGLEHKYKKKQEME